MQSVEKEILENLSKLDEEKQRQVLNYVLDILTTEEMNQRAAVAEEAVKYGDVKTFDVFNAEFKAWQEQKRKSSK